MDHFLLNITGGGSTIGERISREMVRLNMSLTVTEMNDPAAAETKHSTILVKIYVHFRITIM